MDVIGTFTDAESLLSLLRQRQKDLGLSNKGVEDVCGFAGRVIDKYLGPSRTKSPNVETLVRMVRVLGLSGVLVIDAEKTSRMASRWTKRQAGRAHPAERLSKVALVRARPVVLGELARKAAAARWKRATPEMRAEVIHRMNSARLAKRLAGTTASAVHRHKRKGPAVTGPSMS